MHAKLTIGELPDGTEWAYVGSHNLSEKGVKAGTKEWQLLITNKEIVGGLKRWLNDMHMETQYEKQDLKIGSPKTS